VLAFPFRIDPETGRAATVRVGSDQEAAEAIAMLALTRLDERELCPGFGIPDPTYVDDVDVVMEVQAALALWGPFDVTVFEGDTNYDPGAGTATVQITFERTGE
jgi:hypothetical protein